MDSNDHRANSVFLIYISVLSLSEKNSCTRSSEKALCFDDLNYTLSSSSYGLSVGDSQKSSAPL